MPRPISGAAKTGAQRIAAYRARQRDAGRVVSYVNADGTPAAPPIDRRDPAALVQGWKIAFRTLRSIHRAASTWWEREGGVDASGTIVDAAKYDAAYQRCPEETKAALGRIAEFDLDRLRRSPRAPGRIARWENAVAELREQVDYYQQWLDSLPDAIRMAGTALVEKLEATAFLDDALTELENADLPIGWGRD